MKLILHFSLLVAFFLSFHAKAEEYIIFNVSHDFPMTKDQELVKKNFYVNMGSDQGVYKDTLLDVFRKVSILDPYNSQKRIDYKIKIGNIKVLHSGKESAIGRVDNILLGQEDPLFEVKGLMIGDEVEVSVN